MKKVLMVFSVSLFLFSCGETNKTENVEKCKIKSMGNMSLRETLFNHVKQNSYCNQYTFGYDYKDDYGNDKWKPFMKVINFNKGDYEEMRKYNEVGDYLQKYGGYTNWYIMKIK